MFGRLGLSRPRWIAGFHRWNGRVVLLLTLPVAYHCIVRIGFQDTTGRVLAHALLGCALYGAFVAKIMIVRWRRFATWPLATAGAGRGGGGGGVACRRAGCDLVHECAVPVSHCRSSPLARARLARGGHSDPPLSPLALAPHCGFATSIVGNDLTVEQERAKLRLVAETARRVWG